ncbi:hypothetical protein BDW60DRAFT_224138 [Aspergillus nidulans var. acristatus]
MAPRKKTSSHAVPSRSGKKAGKKGNIRNKNQMEASPEAPASPDITSKFEEPSVQPSPLESECEGKDEFHYASSRPGHQIESRSSEAARLRKRSHSLPSSSQSQIASHGDSESASAGNNTANDFQTHTEAIYLLRARTLSGSSDPGPPFQAYLQSSSENKTFVSVEDTPGTASEGTMAFMKASLLDFMSDKRKKNKSKGKKKGKNVSVEEHGEYSRVPAKNDTGNSVTVEEQAGRPSGASAKDNSAELSLLEKGTSQDCDEAGLAAEEQLINDQYPNDTDKGKGKQIVEALETEASDNNATLSPSEHPSVQMKAHTADNATDEAETSSSNDARPPSIESSPEQKSTDASKSVTGEPKSYSDKDAILPSSESLPVQKHAEPGKAQTEEHKSHTGPRNSGATTSPSELAELSSPELSATQKTTEADNAVAGEPKFPTGTEDSKPSTSPFRQNSVEHTSPKIEKLPVLIEGEIQHNSVPIAGSESPVLRASTPRSSGTASNSTAWTSSAPASTPRTTTAASAPSSDHRTKDKGRGKAASLVTGPAPPTSASASGLSSQVISNHAHPSPSASTSSRTIPSSTTGIEHRGRGKITSKKPSNFFWQLDSHGFPCAKIGCPARCNLWDGATVICPKCGPYSETRYCSRTHLLQDIKAHWPICGQAVFTYPCKDSTIPRDVREAPPLIPCLYGFDTPERHRQAVHFNMNHREGDYFIFSDWVDMVNKGALKKSDNDKEKVKLRCSSRIIHVVRFEDAQERDRFRRVLAAVLFDFYDNWYKVTLENPVITDYLYRLIRDHIRSTTNDSPANPLLSLESSLKYQMNKEFAITIQPCITGKRHACPTDWTGRSRRSCTDEVCRSEYKPLLGQRSGGGHKMRIEELESSYWILRAARITHPTVTNALERMIGKGFLEEDGHFGVEEEDRRIYCRGDGWDGAGAGDMEIEGVTC